MVEQMAEISDVVAPTFLMPEPEVEFLNSGANSRWAVAKETACRGNDPSSSWINRFSLRVEELEIVVPRKSKAALAEKRLLDSGWRNVPMRPGDPPATRPEGGFAEMGGFFAGETGDRSLLCFVCMLAVDAQQAFRCPHCPCVSHVACRSEGSSMMACPFCSDDLTHEILLQRKRYAHTLILHVELKASIRLQAWTRGRCRRWWWIKLRSAVKSIQQAVRRRIYMARNAKSKREALRPFRVRINHVVIYAITVGDTLPPPLEVNVGKHLLHAEISSLPAGLYEKFFGCGTGSSEGEAADLPCIWFAGHRNAPHYSGWEGKSTPSAAAKGTKVENGSYVLQVCVNESLNLETTFPKVEKKQLFTRPVPPHKGKQLHRFDILLSCTQVHQTGSTFCVKGLNYLLIPAVRATTEVTLTLVEIKQWPKGFIRGQAKLNCQNFLSRRSACIIESQLCSDPSAWTNPASEDGLKLSYLSWRRHLQQQQQHSDPNCVKSVGLVSWLILPHTDESDQQAGWVNIHSGQIVRRQWCVLIDKSLMLFQNPHELKPYRDIPLSQCSMSFDHNNLIRLKTASDLLHLSAAQPKDNKRWTMKISTQSTKSLSSSQSSKKNCA